MKVYISGVAGQVGSHLADALLSRGDEVMGIDNFSTGKRQHLPESENFKFVEGSIADSQLVSRTIAEFAPDVVVHTAASYKDPSDWEEDIETNVRGGLNLLRASGDAEVRRFIYFQTALIYGTHPDENPIPLSHPRRVDNSSYSISKGAFEDYLSMSGIEFVTFRLANVIGDRCSSGPLPIFYSRLRSGKTCFVVGTRRDFVFVHDLIKVVVQAIDGNGEGTYHFSSGKDVSILELYNAMVEAMGVSPYPQPELREPSVDDAPSILLDPSKTLKDFGPIQFSSLKDIAKAATKYYDHAEEITGFTHLNVSGK